MHIFTRSCYASSFLLAVLLAVSAILMLHASSQESAIMDELAHIPAGYDYANYFDYRLNPEHPPLVKTLAALPLVFMNLSFPTDNAVWTSDLNGQWDAGRLFLYTYNDTRADSILFWARLFPIILTLLLIWFTYHWSRSLMGRWWALIPTFLVALSPHILAHGHYVTTDIGAALGFFMGLYFFVKAIDSPSKKHTLLAGIFFGLAQLMKFSVVLLIPLFVFLVLIRWWAQTREMHSKIFSKKSLLALWRLIRTTFAIFIIGFLLVWLVYVLFTLNYPMAKQQSDTAQLLSSFAHGPAPMSIACNPTSFSMRCLAEIDIWMAHQPILRGLGQYLLGVLMVIQRSAGGNTAYFLGQVSSSGWWYYFPVVFLLKESIPALLLVIGGLFLALWQSVKKGTQKRVTRIAQYIQLNFAQTAMLSLIVLYWLYSIQGTLNIGFRHILPTIPLIYILATIAIKKWMPKKITPSAPSVHTFKKWVQVGFLVIVLGWAGIETFAASPYFLSYFNEFGGGVENGYKTVTDSNYDWGQDLKRLTDFVKENNISKIAIDYFGGGDPHYYMGDAAISWWSAKGSPTQEGINWLAVSVNTIQSAQSPTSQWFTRNPQDEYSWLKGTPLYARAGTSIFIYKLK